MNAALQPIARWQYLSTQTQCGGSAARSRCPARPLKPLYHYVLTSPPTSISRFSFLLVNGGASTAWGVALAVFASGVVPVTWGVSQYGQQHPALTNVIMAGIATLATAHLQYTVRHAAQEHATMRLSQGLPLLTWGWLQGAAAGNIWPPLQSKWTWGGWLLLFVGMAGHSASIVAILQPQSWFDHIHFNDPTPCGMDPARLTLNSNFTAQPAMDQGAFRIGLQLGNYGDQIAANTMTAVPGRVYVKDNFGYGALGGLINGLQEVAGIEIDAWCDSSSDLPSVWASVFPDPPLAALNIKGTGTAVASIASDGSRAVIQSSVNSTYTPFNSTSVSFCWTSMYAALDASGSGAIFIADNSGLSTSCAWVAIPRLVHVEIRGWIAFASNIDDSPTAPAPVGRAVYATLRGIAEAVRLGASLYAPSKGYPSIIEGWYPSPDIIMETLLADGLKSALTQYSVWCLADRDRCGAAGIAICNSNNRTVQEHWRFGNEHFLGITAIVLNIVFGLYALWVWCRVVRRPRVKGVEPFKVVNGFKIGLDTSTAQHEGNADGFWALHKGRVGVRGERWTAVEPEEAQESESVPLDPTGRSP
ncbi:hypothetical protein MVEN_01716600 [Mycena venus]|uniref:Uncharacterized protein n=1 Tax=Mycena venus TaxID=2733690 RepID=A0A8H6XM75_9AGAR|nr:hypothetical protein MVEN_01716600 [Mycena venus]